MHQMPRHQMAHHRPVLEVRDQMTNKIPQSTRDRIMKMIAAGLMTVAEAKKELDRLEKEACGE